MQTETRVFDFIRTHSLIKPGDRVLLGLSGGPDSVCLFHILKGLRQKLQFNLFAGHLDHGLRPDSGRDRIFCAKLCAGFRIPFRAEQAELKPGASEDEARRVRYEFFRKTAAEFSVHSVTTGHNLDDQAETILLNLIRGAGLQGLSGIPPSRPLLAGSETRLIRPLLPVSRAEICRFLKTKGLSFVTDSSNAEDRYRRNQIRHKLLPLLETQNPRIMETLFQTAEIVRADYQYLSETAAGFLKKAQGRSGTRTGDRRRRSSAGRVADTAAAGTGTPAGYEFTLAEFRDLPLSLQREVIRQAVSLLGRNLYRISYETVENIRGFFLTGQACEMSLSDGITAGRRKSVLTLSAGRE